jgi:CDP-glucose 4,6-dehydratase
MSFGDIYKGKKVLITGHTGFKGSWLAIWLKHLGAEVYGYALAPASGDDNFVKARLDTRIVHREGDVRDGAALTRFFQEVSPDFAFHLAAQPLVLLSYSDPVNTFETNLMGVVNFFEAVRKTPAVKVAVNVTSDKCYDNREWVWGYRESDPMGGKDPYSASKGCAELITSSYLNSYFKDSVCKIASARAGNVIGGGDWAQDRIIPDYFRARRQGGKLLLRNPFATRPWQFVLEPLSGYLRLGAALLSGEEKFAGGWNFGPEDSANYSVLELIAKIIALDPRGGYEVLENLTKPHEATFLKLDISKAVNLLKWRPTLSFDETVRFTVDGYNDDENADVYACRVEQILRYTASAEAKGIEWAI